MVEGSPSYDLAEADANRFYPFQTSAPYVVERGKQQYREVYDIIHPLQAVEAARLKLTPFFERQRTLGAEFFQGAGWNGPSGSRRTELVGGVTHEWARRAGRRADGLPRSAPSTWPPGSGWPCSISRPSRSST